MQIAGQSFLVTGGGSGLGRATVAMLHALGGRVTVADLERGEPLPDTLFVETDVTEPAAMQAAIDQAVSQHRGLHGLINCAGIVSIGKVLNRDDTPHDLVRFKRTLEVNLTGTFNAIRLAVKAMAANPPNAEGERGVIVNTASVAAFDGQIGQAAYSASKGGIVALTLPLARELGHHGIRVMAIAPGVFQTPMMAVLPAEAQRSLEQQVPFPPRLGRPQEYAALVRQIIENVMLNGEVIRLDGAIRMAAK